jgi:hypothetical protein
LEKREKKAILKYIMANFNVRKDAKTVNVHLKLSLRAGVKNKSLKQSKGTGASGPFKIGEVVKPKKKLAAKPKKAVKPKAAKPKNCWFLRLGCNLLLWRCVCHFSILKLFQRRILFDERFDYNARLDN